MTLEVFILLYFCKWIAAILFARWVSFPWTWMKRRMRPGGGGLTVWPSLLGRVLSGPWRAIGPCARHAA